MKEKDKKNLQDLTELVFVLDKSGSMSGLESDTIGGYNSMLAKQKDLPGDCRITTVLFNDSIQLLHDRIDIKAVEPISDKDYQVGGTTALLDALGEAMDKIANVQKNTASEFKANKVLFVIITDGQENSSREYSLEQIKKRIETLKDEEAWEFVFLGANIDAVQTAASYGISADRASDYLADEKGTRLNFSAMSDLVAEYRGSAKISDGHFDKIREHKKK